MQKGKAREVDISSQLRVSRELTLSDKDPGRPRSTEPRPATLLPPQQGQHQGPCSPSSFLPFVPAPTLGCPPPLLPLQHSGSQPLLSSCTSPIVLCSQCLLKLFVLSGMAPWIIQVPDKFLPPLGSVPSHSGHKESFPPSMNPATAPPQHFPLVCSGENYLCLSSSCGAGVKLHLCLLFPQARHSVSS